MLSAGICPRTSVSYSLAPSDGERAGVRGKGALGLLYRVQTSFAPQTTFQILVALGAITRRLHQ